MGKITDKYHQAIQPDNKHLNPLFDIKEVPKRTYQLGFAILCVGICIAVYDSKIGMYVSSFLVACLCFSILMFILLKYNEAIKDLSISIISMVCAWLVFSACLEGLQSDQYLYFFPLLISVPLLVNLKQTQYRKSLLFISIIIFSFIVCICVGRYLRPLEDFTSVQIAKLALLNRVTAIGSTLIFGALYTFFEKRYIDELVVQSNRVIDTKTQFLATMGHELRTPLNGIIGVVNLLKQETDPLKRGEYLNILQFCSDHMLQQVNDILDFNKIEAGKMEVHPEEVNLFTLLSNVAKPFIALSHNKRIKILLEIDPALDALVYADDLRLIQIFNNLFANALKFTNDGFIKLKAVVKERINNTINVSFYLQDSGIGIDVANQQKIFESFWQVYDQKTKQLTGTGLGLSICLRLLKLMGSNLILESEAGKGSKFIFDIAFNVVDIPQNNPVTATIEQLNLHGVDILLVEDNEINLMVAKKILTGYKATVTSAYDGKQALDILAGRATFHIILMDLEMPVMNGYETIYEIRKIYPYIPVIALTASLVDQQMMADLLASGFNDCMLKPFKPTALMLNIQKYLDMVAMD